MIRFFAENMQYPKPINAMFDCKFIISERIPEVNENIEPKYTYQNKFCPHAIV